jgi:hypothetical protein
MQHSLPCQAFPPRLTFTAQAPPLTCALSAPSTAATAVTPVAPSSRRCLHSPRPITQE